MDLKSGDHIALLGKVGSGKSTFLRLMSGLYGPTVGRIRVDDFDMTEIEPKRLRASIGYVGQDPQLFRGTLRENLVLSDTNIQDQEIVDVLKKLDFFDVVQSHPLGLEMPLSESGGGLSGGQRQLIALARMMVRNPVYVFMDEPTANMDQATESRVIEVLQTWLAGRTVLLATHRLQLLTWVNRVAVFEHGKCLAEGPRDDIMKSLARGAEIARARSTQSTQQVSE
jgi:ATP-binding cassette subfamily C protein LapB